MSRSKKHHPIVNPVLDIVAAHGPDVVMARLSERGGRDLGAIYDSLVAEQDRRLAAGGAAGRVPLAWQALAGLVGLEVDEAGRIVTGPRQCTRRGSHFE